MKLLLDRGAQDRSFRPKTARQLCIAPQTSGHDITVKLLLDRGAQIEASNKDGLTALHWASSNGHDATVKLLLDRGAQIEASNKDGLTALH